MDSRPALNTFRLQRGLICMFSRLLQSSPPKSSFSTVWKTSEGLPDSRFGFPLVLGVVHTPVKSRALPSMVFILRKMSALLQVDSAGDSVSGLPGLRASFLCRRTPWKRESINPTPVLKAKVKLGNHATKWKLCFFSPFRRLSGYFYGGTKGSNEGPLVVSGHTNVAPKLIYFTNLISFQLTRENAMMWTHSLKEMPQQ